MNTPTVLQRENLALRHQLLDLRRTAPKVAAEGNGPHLMDRNLAAVRRPENLARDCATETVVDWHRTPFRAFWRCINPPRQARPARSSQEHPRTDPPREPGQPDTARPRIHGELLKLGTELAASSVSKYLVGGRLPSSRPGARSLRSTSVGCFSSTS